jgi:hypothetical protein
MDLNVANNEELENWHSETIFDTNYLFMRVHKDNIYDDGTLKPGAFRNRPPEEENQRPGMSTDWDKYSSPLDTKLRAKDPSKNAVIQMSVAEIRNISNQVVEHTPNKKYNNRSHTDIFGEKKDKERSKFIEISKIVLKLDT